MNDNENVQDPSDVDAVRAVVLSAYPDCVPELVQGATVAELLASVEPARAAYARVAAVVTDRSEPPATAGPPVVPAGGGSAVVDPGALPPAEKVRRGIEQHRR